MGDGGLSAGCLADDRGCMTTADSEADVSGVDAADSSEAIEVHGHGKDGLAKLALSAVGVVFGDIGTSPLYAFRETFVGHHPLAVDNLHVLGVLSLLFWSMMLVVTIKYVKIGRASCRERVCQYV